MVDLLRFLAAVGVAAYHLATASLRADAPIRLFARDAVPTTALAGWTRSGWVGVEIFFVISGFVIAWSIEGSTARDFLRRRLLRLVPAAWLCASLTALVLAAGNARSGIDIARRWGGALLLLPTSATIDPSYWTLEVELVFYLLAAWTIARRGRGIAWLATRLGMASGGFWIVATSYGWAPGDPDLTVAVNLTLLPHGAFFALGMMLMLAQRQGWTATRAGGVLALAAVGVAEIAAHAVALGDRSVAAPMLVFAAALVAIAAAPSAQPLLRRWPGVAPLVRAGRVTYPLYLLHQVIGAALIAAGLRLGASAGVAIAGAAAIVLCAAFLVSETLEPWLRARLAGLLSPGRAPSRGNRPTASPPAG